MMWNCGIRNVCFKGLSLFLLVVLFTHCNEVNGVIRTEKAQLCIKYDDADIVYGANNISQLISNETNVDPNNYYDQSIHIDDSGNIWIAYLESLANANYETDDQLWISVYDPNNTCLCTVGVAQNNISTPTLTGGDNNIYLTYEMKDEFNKWFIECRSLSLDGSNQSLNLSSKIIIGDVGNNINHQAAIFQNNVPGLAVVYQEGQNGKYDIDLYDSVSETDFTISSTGTNWNPDVVFNDSNVGCVVWTTYCEGNYHVLARKVTLGSSPSVGDIICVASGSNSKFMGNPKVTASGDMFYICWEEGAENWGTEFIGDAVGLLGNDNTDDYGPLHRYRSIHMATLGGADIQNENIVMLDVDFPLPSYNLDWMSYSNNLIKSLTLRNNTDKLGIYYEKPELLTDSSGKVWVFYRHFRNEMLRRVITDEWKGHYEQGWRIYGRYYIPPVDSNDNGSWSPLIAFGNENSDVNSNDCNYTQIDIDGDGDTDDSVVDDFHAKYHIRDGMQRLSIASGNSKIATAWTVGRTDFWKDRLRHYPGDMARCVYYSSIADSISGEVLSISDPIVDLRFNEDNESITYDSSGNENDGTLVNGVTWSNDGSLCFDGNDGYIQINNYKGVDGSNSRTCSAWIKTSDNNPQAIISWGSFSEAGNCWIFRTEYGGTIGVGVVGGWIKTTATVNDGQWHHVAVVLDDDGSADVSDLKFYIDGELQTSTVTSSTPSDPCPITTITDSNNVLIGARYKDTDPNSYGYFFNGQIDNVSIYDTSLSEDTIRYVLGCQRLIDNQRLDTYQATGNDTDSIEFDDYVLSFGDLHRHTDLSRCRPFLDGTAETAYKYAKDVAGLDFMAITDHAEHLDNGNFLSQLWGRYCKFVTRYNLSGSFASFYGYERSNYEEYGDNGDHHYNVISLDNVDPILTQTSGDGTAQDFAQYIADYHLRRALMIPHCTWPEVIPDIDSPEMDPSRRLVEIYQSCRPYETGDEFCINNVRNALGKGAHFGLIASSDHVATSTSYACAWVTDTDSDDKYSTEEKFRALFDRRTYGATNKLGLVFRTTENFGNHWMGDDPFYTNYMPDFEICIKPVNPENLSNAKITVFCDDKGVDDNFESNGSGEYEISDLSQYYDDNSGWLTLTLTLDPNLYDTNRIENFALIEYDEDGYNKAWSSPIWFIIEPELVSHYDFYDGTLNDNSGINYPGELFGNAGVVDVGLERDFVLSLDNTTSTTDYMEIEDFKGISGSDSRTCCAWIKTYSYNSQTIMSWGSFVEGEKWIFRTETDGGIGVGVYGGYKKTIDVDLVDNFWHHVAVVLEDDGTADVSELKFYVDGILVDSEYSNTQVINTSALENVLIGTRIRDNEFGYSFSGQIDDIRIYSVALSDTDISKITRAGYWPLDSLTNNVVLDESGNENHGGTYGDPNVVNDNGDECIHLDGNDYLTLPAGIFDASQPFSIFAKVKLENARGLESQTIFQQLDGSSGVGKQFLFRTGSNRIGGADRLVCYLDGSYVYSEIPIFSELNCWHHVGMVFDGYTIYQYIDGFLTGQASAVGSYSSGSFRVGAHKYDDNKTYYDYYGINHPRYSGDTLCWDIWAPWNGLIDDIIIYPYAVSDSKVAELAGGN